MDGGSDFFDANVICRVTYIIRIYYCYIITNVRLCPFMQCIMLHLINNTMKVMVRYGYYVFYGQRSVKINTGFFNGQTSNSVVQL